MGETWYISQYEDGEEMPTVARGQERMVAHLESSSSRRMVWKRLMASRDSREGARA